MSRASALFRLQSIDLELDRISERQEEIGQTLTDDKEIKECGEIARRATSLYENLHSKTTAADHEVLAQRDKIRKTEETLYSGTIRNPKELEDLQLESESLKRYLITLEDRLLELMVELEEAEEKKVAAEKALELATDEWDKLHAQLIHEREKLNKKAQTLQQEREAALAGIAEGDMQIYQELRERFSGLAIATLVDKNCNSCGLEIPPSIQQSIRSGTELVRCPQCHRILYSG